MKLAYMVAQLQRRLQIWADVPIELRRKLNDSMTAEVQTDKASGHEKSLLKPCRELFLKLTSMSYMDSWTAQCH